MPIAVMGRLHGSIIVVALLPVTTEHLVRFINKALRFSDARAQRRLAVLYFACLLGASVSPLLFVWHGGLTDDVIR